MPAISGVNNSDDILLAVVSDKFIDAKRSNGSASSSVVAYGFAVTGFRNIVCGEANNKHLYVGEVTKNHMRKYVDLMQMMPKNTKTNLATKGMSNSELVRFLSANNKADLLKQGVDFLAPKTVSGRFTIVRELLRYIEEQQYPIQPNLGSMVKYAGKGGEKIKAKRRSFNDQELKLIFESDQYRLCKFKRASDYWVPLLALFTGATQGELLQLYVEDVRQENGTWLIDINDKGDKRLKNQVGRRGWFHCTIS